MIYSSLLLWAAILCAVYALQWDAPAPGGLRRVLPNNTLSTTSLRQDVSTSSTPHSSPLSSTSESSSSPISTSSTFATSQSSLPTALSTLSNESGPQLPSTIDPFWLPSTTQASTNDGEIAPHPSSIFSSPTIVKAGGVNSGGKLLPLATGRVIQSDNEGRDGLVTDTTTSDSRTPASSDKVGDGSEVNSTPLALTSALVYTAVTIGDTTSPLIRTAAPSSRSSIPKDAFTQIPPSTRLSFSAYHNTSINIQVTTKDRSQVPSTTRAISDGNNTTLTRKTSAPDCTPLLPYQTLTVWKIEPNTNTVTVTLYGNESNTYTTKSEFTPPVYCPLRSSAAQSVPAADTRTILPFQSHTDSFLGAPFPASTQASPAFPFTTTYITTSKNPVTVFTTDSAPIFPGGGRTEKHSVQVPPTPSSAIVWNTQPPPPTNTPVPVIGVVPGMNMGGGFHSLPIPVTVAGVPVVVGPSTIVIGKQTFTPGPSAPLTAVTEGGQTFTVNPSQVIGPGTVLSIPTQTGGVFVETPAPTVINGVSVQMESGIAVVAGTTFNVRPGAPEESIVANDQTISIGPGGVGFSQTTITQPAILPTNVVIFDGKVYSAVGASVVVFDGSSFTYTQGSNPQTAVFNGDSITLGPSGVVDGTTTLGGPSHPTGTELGIAGGMSISEIGSTIAAIDGTTLIVGPGAPSTTAVIQGKTIIASPSGLNINGETTLAFPFNPTMQEVTAGGITFSEIGASLVDIGGNTFTVGPGATPTTDIVDGQTISIGPGGVGFLTTTVVPFTSTPTATSTGGKKKNDGSVASSPAFGAAGILSMCIAVGVGFIL